jgi:hypothetical protein
MWYVLIFTLSGMAFSVNETLTNSESVDSAVNVNEHDYQVRQEEKTRCYLFGDISLNSATLGGFCPATPTNAKVILIDDDTGLDKRACCKKI